MPSIGPTELVLVFLIALVVLGPKRLPGVGRQIGRALREFRAATSEIRTELSPECVQATILPNRPAATSSTAWVPNMVQSVRSKLVGLPPRWRWPSTHTRDSLPVRRAI